VFIDNETGFSHYYLIMRHMDAVIFDMDGVIVDSEPIHQRVERALFEELRLPVTDTEHEAFLGTSSPDMFTAIAAAHREEWRLLNRTVAEVVALERRRYQEALQEGTVPLVDGAVSAIRGAADRGFAVAIASSAPREQIADVVRITDTRDVIQCTRSADDVTHSKPDPEIYLSAATCLGTTPERCWVVEDSTHGVRAAVSAGMRCIAYRNPNSGEPDLSAAEIVLDSMEEVLSVISSGGD
jgi:HAD superfamily hydrolase (TIGR01509 family)